MEKPDEKGFVQVNWPSKSIPHGGIFHTTVVEPSKEQQRFLKVLLEESKLTISQRRKGAYVLRTNDEVVLTRKETQPVAVVRPRTSRRRSLSAIRESGIYTVDEYRPMKKGEDREKLKDNLVQQMAYGDKEQTPAPPIPRPKHKLQLPTKKEQWNDLVTQIRERADWLAEMEYLGQGAQYRDLVNGQIAERMRALDALGVDSECSTERSTTSKPAIELSVRSSASAGSRNSSKLTTSCNKKKKLSRTFQRYD